MIETLIDSDFDIDADSFLDFEAKPESATLEAIDWTGVPAPKVIAEDADSVTMTMKIRASIKYEASFSYYVRDGMDKDYVNLGWRQAEKVQENTFEIALSVSREADGEPSVVHLQFGSAPHNSEFRPHRTIPQRKSDL